jgi:hypothetical protein
MDPLDVVLRVGGFLLGSGVLWKIGELGVRWWDRRTLLGLSGEFYTKADLDRYTRYYIPPHCQTADPAGQEDYKSSFQTKESMIEVMDRIVSSPGSNHYMILLADSGM